MVSLVFGSIDKFMKRTQSVYKSINYSCVCGAVSGRVSRPAKHSRPSFVSVWNMYWNKVQWTSLQVLCNWVQSSVFQSSSLQCQSYSRPPLFPAGTLLQQGGHSDTSVYTLNLTTSIQSLTPIMFQLLCRHSQNSVKWVLLRMRIG